jgi:RimJ/RimL family protein N-acetyltransferase
VADKIGLIEEGLMRQHIYTAGRRLDVVPYAALRDEWLPSKGDAARACFFKAPF